MNPEFRIQLDVFRGPLDLLLYLVKKHEVEVTQIPIALIAEQYQQHLDVLRELDVDAVGDFLEVASTLVEIKSRTVLPAEEEEFEQLEDPREELVQRLLEYKKFKDAASILDEQSRQWQHRFARIQDDAPQSPVDASRQPIQDVEMWDLVSAFGRVLRDRDVESEASIIYDETPMHVHMENIRQRIRSAGQTRISELFHPGMHKSTMVGVFLAILELVRHHSIQASQEGVHGEIEVLPGRRFDQPIDAGAVEQYDSSQIDQQTASPPEDSLTEEDS